MLRFNSIATRSDFIPNSCKSPASVSGGVKSLGWPLMTRFINSILASKAPQRQERQGASSVKFKGNELGVLLARVGQCVGIAAGQPFHVARLEVSGHRPLAFDVAAYVEVGDSNH